jgi:hypothetical protein
MLGFAVYSAGAAASARTVGEAAAEEAMTGAAEEAMTGAAEEVMTGAADVADGVKEGTTDRLGHA